MEWVSDVGLQFSDCVGLVELKVLGGVFGFLKLSLNSVN